MLAVADGRDERHQTASAKLEQGDRTIALAQATFTEAVAGRPSRHHVPPSAASPADGPPAYWGRWQAHPPPYARHYHYAPADSSSPDGEHASSASVAAER